MSNIVGIVKDEDYDHSFRCYVAGALLAVGCDGKVALCEYDWKKTADLGNVHTDSLLDIFRKKAALDHQLQTLGNREASDVCMKCSRQFRKETMITPVFQKIQKIFNCHFNEVVGTIRNNFTDVKVQEMTFLGRRFNSYKECLDLLEEMYLKMGSINDHQVAFLLAVPCKPPVPGQGKKQYEPAGDDVPVYFLHAVAMREKWAIIIKEYLGANLIYVDENIKLLDWSEDGVI